VILSLYFLLKLHETFQAVCFSMMCFFQIVIVHMIHKLYNMNRLQLYLHGMNIIHRDLKPKNIIIDPARGPVLIDFGAGKEGWNQVNPGDATIMYTPGWSCPHQVQGQLTSSCDLYSIGAILYYMVVGKLPSQNIDSRTHRLKRKPNQMRTGITPMVSEVIVNAIDPDHKQISVADDMLSYFARKIIAPTNQSYVVIDVDIGRLHTSCDQNCNAIGYKFPPSIAIEESGPLKYISKHHVRIWKDKNGYYWIQDLRSRNGTAISKQGVYQLIAPGQKEMLVDQSNIAICYHRAKGPYLTFTFHER